MRAFADFHTHTRYSHGRGTIADNVAAARARGLLQVGISDHGPANLFGVGVRHPRVFRMMREEIRRLEATGESDGIQVFLGVEANVVDLHGSLDLPEDVLAELDYVMVGLHVPVRPARWSDAVRFAALNVGSRLTRWACPRARRVNTEALIRAVERYRIDVVTHPGWRLNIDTPQLARVCAERGTALEVNTSHDHGGVEFIAAAAAEGVDFIIGSDAHSPDRVGDLQRGIDLLQQAGVGPERIRNVFGPGGKPSAAIEQRLHARRPAARLR